MRPSFRTGTNTDVSSNASRNRMWSNPVQMCQMPSTTNSRRVSRRLASEKVKTRGAALGSRTDTRSALLPGTAKRTMPRWVGSVAAKRRYSISRERGTVAQSNLYWNTAYAPSLCESMARLAGAALLSIAQSLRLVRSFKLGSTNASRSRFRLRTSPHVSVPSSSTSSPSSASRSRSAISHRTSTDFCTDVSVR